MADGPSPVLDVVGLSGMALITLGAVGYGIYTAATAPAPIAIPEIKLEVKEKDGVLPGKPLTRIYRYHASKNDNLAPRKDRDYDGLSFSLKPPRPGIPSVMTTVDQVNATGILIVTLDGGTHVTIKPSNGTVRQWMDQGQDSIWTQALSTVVIELNQRRR